MAKPDIENGYTKIANELLDAICRTKLTNYEYRVFMMIIRKTYGYNKKTDWIAQKQIVENTGICKANISRTVKELKAKNMIVKEGKKIGIQKDYDQWKLSTKLSNQITINKDKKLSHQITEVISPDNKKLSHQIYPSTKEKKDNIQKKDIYRSDDSVNNFYEEDKDKETRKQIEEIVIYLNEKTGKNFRSSKADTIKTIIARLNEGYTLDDFKKVIDIKTSQWKDTEYDKFLRPKTLFGNKFEGYLNEKIIKGGEYGKSRKHFENEREYTEEEQRVIDEKFYS